MWFCRQRRLRTEGRQSRHRRAATLLGLALVAVNLTAVPGASAAPGVEPANSSVVLAPGGSLDIAKTVHTPTVPPKPDVVFLADTTGSMGGAITNVRTNAAGVMAEIVAAQPNAQFGVAQYRDEGDDPLFRVDQGLTGNQTAVQAGIDTWIAGGGGDFPEAGLNALFQLASGAVTFRDGGTRIVVIFGDAPSHDPSNGHTLAGTIAALQAQDVRVVAVNVGDLNNGGQMQAIVDATGGVLLNNVPSNEVAAAILAGIEAIDVTVQPQVVSCDAPLSLAFTPASRTVDSGADAAFTEKVTVASNAAGGTYHCSVDFLVDGASHGFVQKLTVVVLALSINDVTVNEGAGTASFTVTLSAASPASVSASYATSNGTATAPGDYTATNGVVTFAPGQTSRTVTVPIVNDTVDEVNETFQVTLSAPSGAALADPTGVGTIVDNDRNGTFSCTATSLQVGPLTAPRANPANVPCVDDSKSVATVTLNSGAVSVQAKVLSATTDQTPNSLVVVPAAGDNATATARVEQTKIVVGLITVEVGVITSKASATCQPQGGGLAPKFAGASSIASLKVNGVPVTVGTAPLNVPLAVGSLRINSTTTTATSITQDALILDLPLVDVVIGHSHADIEGTVVHPGGNPCQA
jgi:hypothetical protein